jgi:hypothetical protein
MYIHHTSITIHSFFLHIFHFPGQAGCPPLAVNDLVLVMVMQANAGHGRSCKGLMLTMETKMT